MSGATLGSRGAAGRRVLPVDGDAAGGLGMLAQPTAGEAAPWHDGEVLGGCPFDCSSYETSPDAVATELVGDLGVNQDDAPGLSSVDELGDCARVLDDEAVLALDVADLRALSVGHGWTVM